MYPSAKERTSAFLRVFVVTICDKNRKESSHAGMVTTTLIDENNEGREPIRTWGGVGIMSSMTPSITEAKEESTFPVFAKRAP